MCSALLHASHVQGIVAIPRAHQISGAGDWALYRSFQVQSTGQKSGMMREQLDYQPQLKWTHRHISVAMRNAYLAGVKVGDGVWTCTGCAGVSPTTLWCSPAGYVTHRPPAPGRRAALSVWGLSRRQFASLHNCCGKGNKATGPIFYQSAGTKLNYAQEPVAEAGSDIALLPSQICGDGSPLILFWCMLWTCLSLFCCLFFIFLQTSHGWTTSLLLPLNLMICPSPGPSRTSLTSHHPTSLPSRQTQVNILLWRD